MAKAPSQRKLDSLRREWQKRLRLQDWKVKARIVGPGVITEDDLGCCQYVVEAKEAVIEILDPAHAVVEGGNREQDVENTLVHELLHCHFAPFYAHGEKMSVTQEQAIEAISGALVELKRGKRG